SVQAFYNNPRVSPDGKRIVYSITTAGGHDLWVKDIDRDTPTRLTFFSQGQQYAEWPFWTPDSKAILFGMTGSADLYWVDADGSGAPELLAKGANVLQGLGCVSNDGKTLVFAEGLPEGGYQLKTAAIEGERGHRKLGAAQPLLPTSFDDRHPAISPDGKW